MFLSRLNVCTALLAAFMLSPPPSAAQGWPTKPITVIIPNEAGGGIDVIGRLLQPHMEKTLSQPIVIINKGGAAGAIGAEMMARAEPNGYTLLLTANGPLEVVPAIRKTSYDPQMDFLPVGAIGAYPSFLVVPAALGVNTFPELLVLARSKPAQLNYGSVGLGSTSNLNTEQVLRAAGIKVTHVPYKGGGQVQQALLANEVQFTITTGSNVLPHVASGKLKLLAISSADLASVAPPGTPAISDTLPGVRWKGYYALFAPKGVDVHVMNKLSAALRDAVARPEVREAMMDLGVVPAAEEDLGALMREGIDRTRRVVQDANLKLE